MDSGNPLVDVLRSSRAIFDQDNANLTPVQLERAWQRHWNWLSSQITGATNQPRDGLVVPQKRSSCSEAHFGMEPAPKRPGPVGTPVILVSFLV